MVACGSSKNITDQDDHRQFGLSMSFALTDTYIDRLSRIGD